MAKIMVIEDDHSLSGLLKEYLIQMGHDVVINYNSVSAIRVLKSELFDLILTDVQMYPVDGYQLINEVRQFNKDVKIVAMSGAIPDTQRAKNRTITELGKEGAGSFLSKPFSYEDLKVCLDEALAS